MLITIGERQVTLDGLMTLGKLETGLHALQFECCEDQLEQLPEKLVRQAGTIARKVTRELICK